MMMGDTVIPGFSSEKWIEDAEETGDSVSNNDSGLEERDVDGVNIALNCCDGAVQ